MPIRRKNVSWYLKNSKAVDKAIDEQQRYTRQISLDIIGDAGQEKLTAARVAIVGCGGLGALAAAYLAGAGIGFLRLIDGDEPDVSNLHRQVFFKTGEKESKSIALAKHLGKLNPVIDLDAYSSYLDRQNAEELLGDVDLVLECTDQAFVKHLVSDFCALEEIPLVYGAVHKTQGYVALFANQHETDCHLRDLFPEPDSTLPTCAEVGVLNTAAGLIGMLQANEALKWLLGAGESLTNRLLTYDCLTHQQQIIKLAKTFTADLETVWEAGNYGGQTIDAEQVTWDDLQHWPKGSYQLISLLAAGREPEMLAGAERYQKSLLGLPGKKVFYCQYGRQSLAVAKQLRGQGVEAFSLVGGLSNQ